MKWFLRAVAAVGGAVALFLLPVAVSEITTAVQTLAQAPQVRVLVFGDLMLDRAVRTNMQQHSDLYPFVRIAPLLQNQDIVVANAEGVFTHHASVATGSNLVFTFATTTLPILKQLGFTLLSQANNHALNFGWDGLAESKANIEAAGLQSFGDPDNVDPGPVTQTVNDIKVAFVGYDQFAIQGTNASSTLAAIRAVKHSGAFVIVYAHWGDEYNATTTLLQEVRAHQFVDAGADAVVGAHPHVIEPVEIYKGKAIFYSLGNFVFDQQWDAAVSHGLAIHLTITNKEVFYTLTPFAIIKEQPTPIDNDEASSTLAAAGITERSFVLDRYYGADNTF